MVEPYLSEISIFSFNYAPNGYACCDGSQLQADQNRPLCTLLSKTYGGDGIRTFNLPNLKGRVPVGVPVGGRLGQTGGQPSVTLAYSQLTGHSHTVYATSTPANSVANQGNSQLASSNDLSKTPVYAEPDDTITLNSLSVSYSGGFGPHTNLQPYIGMMFCIAIYGEYPPRW